MWTLKFKDINKNKINLGVRNFSSQENLPDKLVCAVSQQTEDIKPEKYYDDVYTMKSQILSENKHKSGIYRFTNKLNGNIYIGSSKDLRVRFYTYYKISPLSRNVNNTIIAKALLKYGFSNFSLEILEYCGILELLEREQYYIDLLSPSYNVAKKAGSNLGIKFSDEFKSKIRKVRLGQTHSAETKLLMSQIHSGENNSMFNKTHTEQTKELIRLSKVGKVRDIKTREAISASNGTSVYLYALCTECSMVKYCLVKEFLSIRALAKYLNKSHSTVSRYLESGNLITVKNGKYKVSKTLLEN